MQGCQQNNASARLGKLLQGYLAQVVRRCSVKCTSMLINMPHSVAVQRQQLDGCQQHAFPLLL